MIQWESAIFRRFYISSIFQDGGMVMDEAGRNGENWHLAQQLADHVIA